MATPLDISLIGYFEVIFPFLLVMAIVYGALSYMKPFGDNVFVYGLISVTLSIVVIISSISRAVINNMAPWFVLLFFVIIFILLSIRMFGISEGSIVQYVTKNSTALLTVVVIGVIIGFGSVAQTVSEQGGIGVTSDNASQVIDESSSGDLEDQSQINQFWATLVHPKVLGMIFILVVAALTVSRLTYSP